MTKKLIAMGLGGSACVQQLNLSGCHTFFLYFSFFSSWLIITMFFLLTFISTEWVHFKIFLLCQNNNIYLDSSTAITVVHYDNVQLWLQFSAETMIIILFCCQKAYRNKIYLLRQTQWSKHQYKLLLESISKCKGLQPKFKYISCSSYVLLVMCLWSTEQFNLKAHILTYLFSTVTTIFSFLRVYIYNYIYIIDQWGKEKIYCWDKINSELRMCSESEIYQSTIFWILNEGFKSKIS